MKRGSGILLHISSLPSPGGIGTFGKECYDFLEFLKQSKQSYWQILPLGPTGYGDSPYQSFSTFAGNPYFIDLRLLAQQGLLPADAVSDLMEATPVDYGHLYQTRFQVLRQAFSLSPTVPREFLVENQDWLEDYALFMALKKHFGAQPWQTWEKGAAQRDEGALSHYREMLSEEIQFQYFLQYHFYQQWNALRERAKALNIQIIGDLPIYVATDSADTWSHPELYYLDSQGNPTEVAGCPPDSFSADGQLWGNPIYRRETHLSTGYAWWTRRISHASKLYDIVRIDHFRGFDSYWSIPAYAKTAVCGHWENGFGLELFQHLKQALPHVQIIAEDLGFLTPSVRELKENTGFPGMKVLQFAFDSREDSDYLPHNYEKNCVVYTGTHDNDTTAGWLDHATRSDVEYAADYLKLTHSEGYVWGFIRGAHSSCADVSIIPMQDYLCLGSTARMNTPSTLGSNWRWRMSPTALTADLSSKIASLCSLYGRGRI